jgi:hypothetical protein
MTSLSKKVKCWCAIKGLRNGIDDVNLQTKTAGAQSKQMLQYLPRTKRETVSYRRYLSILVLIFCFLFIKMTLAIKRMMYSS